MTSDKLNSTIDFCIENKAELVLSVNDTIVFIDFNDDNRYIDTFTYKNHLYSWNYIFNHWNVISIDSINTIQIQIN